MSPTLSHVPPKAGLSHYTRQTPSDSSLIKITTELKKISLNFDNAMYQTIIIFQKKSAEAATRGAL